MGVSHVGVDAMNEYHLLPAIDVSVPALCDLAELERLELQRN